MTGPHGHKDIPIEDIAAARNQALERQAQALEPRDIREQESPRRVAAALDEAHRDADALKADYEAKTPDEKAELKKSG